MTKIQSVLENS